MSLFTKHRPKNFSEMVGNKHIITSVKALTEKKDVPHSWLFTGMSGSGKTTIARIIAKNLGASSSGIFEINSADLTGVDSVRDIAKQCRYKVPGSSVSVFIFDECHQWSSSSQNAILKVLEDAPAHAYFILATTDPRKLLGTIRTRCEEFKFDPVGLEDLADLILRVAQKENIELLDDIILEIAENAAGSPRLALNMLEKCSSIKDIESARKLISGLGIDFQVEGEFSISGKIFDVLQQVKNPRVAWRKITEILDRDILKPRADVNAIKQGLTNRLGRFVLTSAHSGAADAVILLETMQSMYTNASFIAIMFKTVEIYYKEGGTSNAEAGRGTSSGNFPK